MRIDRFGLGDRWPRPKQAAAGALDHLPPDQWPVLAAKWLAAGFDSPSLRQLAQLQTGESPAGLRADRRGSSRRGGLRAQPAGPGQPVPAEVRRLQRRLGAALDARELMPEVLRSLGFDPAPASEEFMARCQSAVDVVQHDLDATGYGRYQRYPRSNGRSAPSTAVIRTLSGTARTPSTSSRRRRGGGAPAPGIRSPRSASSPPRPPERANPTAYSYTGRHER